jgi:hypothetical protein
MQHKRSLNRTGRRSTRQLGIFNLRRRKPWQYEHNWVPPWHSWDKPKPRLRRRK